MLAQNQKGLFFVLFCLLLRLFPLISMRPFPLLPQVVTREPYLLMSKDLPVIVSVTCNRFCDTVDVAGSRKN